MGAGRVKVRVEDLEAWPEVAIGDGPELWVIRVTDLKQWAYCPRVVYFAVQWPKVRPVTYEMEEGRIRHEEERQRFLRIRRRRGGLVGLPAGEYVFDVFHQSETLRLNGKVDLVIVGEEEIIPVDFKDSLNVKATHFRVQLMAYGLLMEEKFEKPARRGFIYSLPRRRGHEVRFTARLRNDVYRLLKEMVSALEGERMPEGPSSSAPCVACEFRRFCNDRL